MHSNPVLACGLLLAACGQAPSSDVDAARIDCVTGDAPLSRDCTIERTGTEEGAILTLRKPDGGFRRLLLTADGIEAADGAESAQVAELEDGRIEIAIGDDRFLLPPEAL